LIAAAGAAETWQGQNWDAKAKVPVTTLDLLIDEFGQPDFIKIDVEGFELEVLKGLSTPPALLSFEFTTIQREMAVACIDHVSTLGNYTFNYSLGEDHHLHFDDWVSGAKIQAILRELPMSANSGDIFVKRM
jgi:hypothetical protein